jgi:hypothetical protein
VVAVGDVLRVRVVLAVVEIPAGDVVDVAVAVVVGAVRALDDEVLGVEVAVAVVIGRPGEVEDVEPRVAVRRVAARAHGLRHRLVGVDVDLLDELVGAVPPVVHAALDVGDDRVRAAEARERPAARRERRPVDDVLPGRLERHARRALLVLGERVLRRVDDAAEAVLPALGRRVAVGRERGPHHGAREHQPDGRRREPDHALRRLAHGRNPPGWMGPDAGPIEGECRPGRIG